MPTYNFRYELAGNVNIVARNDEEATEYFFKNKPYLKNCNITDVDFNVERID